MTPLLESRRVRLPVLLLALLVLPTSVAQSPGSASLTVFTEDPGRAFTPGALEPVTVVVTYSPGQLGRPTPAPTPDRPENTTPTRITFTAKQQPSWVSEVSFDPPEVFIDVPYHNATVASYSRRVNAILRVVPDAPALERESFVVTASAESNGNIPAMTADSAELKLRATVVGILNVSAPESVVLPGGRWTTIVYTVRNEGNSEIVAKLNVTVRPENSQVEFPDTLQLARGETREVEVRVRTPWTAAEFGSLELEATPIVDAEGGTPARREVQVRGESAVPAGALLPLAALAMVALLARRR